MELLKLLLGINLLFITANIITGNNTSVELFNRQFESIKLIQYDLDLILYMNDEYKNTDIYETFKSYIDEQRAKGNFIFYGESTLFFEDINGKRIIRLHALNLEIDIETIKIIFHDNGFDNMMAPEKYVYHKEAHIIDIYFDYPFVRNINTYRLIMKFVGRITNETGGFVKISYINNKEKKTWLIAADFLGAGARQIFPCWDQPYTRTNFTIFVKHHRNYTVLSNSPIFANVNFTDDGMIWTYFKTTDKISPYHLAVVMSDLDLFSVTNWWCRQQVKQKIKFAQTFAENAILNLKYIFKNEKHVPKMNHVVIPGFRDEGMESWRLILYRESAIIYDEKLDSETRKFEVGYMIARKLVYQFFGNLVGQSQWSYLWLNEGIATFLAMNIVSQFVHEMLVNLLTLQFHQESLRVNDYYDMPLIPEVNTSSDINSLFSYTYYVKAPVFVRTLLQAVPIEAYEIDKYFKKCINKYLTLYQYKSIDTSVSTIDNFFNVLQEVLEDEYKTTINFTKRYTLWTKQKRYPVLQVTRESSGKKIMMSLSQNYPNESYPNNLWIYVTYITEEYPYVIKKTWLSPHEPILHLNHINKDHWVIVNVQQSGYYRVNYDNDNWQKLINYLNSYDIYAFNTMHLRHLNISVQSRAQIIDDAYYFLSTNKLNFNIFKNLTNYLSKETDYVAWYPMFKILEQISGFFPFPQSIEVKKHFQNILDFILKKIEYIFVTEELKKNIFHKCLKQEVSKWACFLNSTFCRSSAFSKLKKIQKIPIWPGWEEWTYCYGLSLADDIEWNHVLTKVSNTGTLYNKFFKYLACSENDSIIIDYMNYMQPGYYNGQHHIIIFHSIVARHAKNNLVLDYILNNFDQIIPWEIDAGIALMNIINHIYDKKQLYKVYNFAKGYFSFKNLLYIDKKIITRMLEIKKHIGYFESFLKTK